MSVDLTKYWPDFGTIILAALVSALILIFFPKLRDDAGLGDVPFWMPFAGMFICILTVVNLASYALNVGKAETEITITEKNIPSNHMLKFGVNESTDQKLLSELQNISEREYLKGFPKAKNVTSGSEIAELADLRFIRTVVADSNAYWQFNFLFGEKKAVSVICSLESQDSADFDQLACDNAIREQMNKSISRIAIGSANG